MLWLHKKILGGLLRMSKIDNNIDPTLHDLWMISIKGTRIS